MTGGFVAENKANTETAVFLALDADEDDSHTFQLIDGNSVFLIEKNKLITRKGFDYEVSFPIGFNCFPVRHATPVLFQ